MSSSVQRDRRAYQPGHLVPVSGIYTVVHRRHRSDHEVLAIRGEEFPTCRVCQEDVKFYILQVIPHVTHDFDLTGPLFRMPQRKAKAANGLE